MFPVPHIQEYSHRISGYTSWSKIGLVRVYHKIPVHPQDIQKKAITTTFGLFEIPFNSFGLSNADLSFQSFIDDNLKDLNLCFAYIDDILVFSRSPPEHDQQLRIPFTHLQNYGTLLNPSRYVSVSLKFHFESKNYIHGFPAPSRTYHRYPCLTPNKNVRKLRHFTGMLNFYRRFLRHATTLEAPIHNVLSARCSRVPILSTGATHS